LHEAAALGAIREQLYKLVIGSRKRQVDADALLICGLQLFVDGTEDGRIEVFGS